jgi:tetratricopeptide (TPR) repeat protein
MSNAPPPPPNFSAKQLIQHGQSCLNVGDISGAIAHFTAALQAQPSAEGFLKRATAHLINQNGGAAIIDATAAIQLAPTLAVAHRTLAKAQALVGRLSDAIATYKQAAHLYLNQSDPEGAKACVTQIEALRSTLQPQAPPSPPLLSPQDFLDQAIAKLEQHNYRGAIADLTWMLKFEATNVNVLCKRAYAYAKTQQTQAAIQDIATAVKLAPHDPSIIEQRGIIRLLLNDSYGAIQDFSNLLQHGHDPSLLLPQRAKAYAQMGAWNEAFKDYANALGLQPNNPALYAGRGAVWEAMGDRQEALKDYRQAASLWMNDGRWSDYQAIQNKINILQGNMPAKPTSIRLPIKYKLDDAPIVEVVLNDIHRFNMVLDPEFSLSIISPLMARTAGVTPNGTRWCYTNTGAMLELAVGLVKQIALGSAVHSNVTVAIAPQETEAVLGQNVLSQYQLYILDQEVELVPKQP